jgi:serine/threonine-protein phosphatase 2A activator
VPAKKIDDPVTLEQFKNSDACKEIIGFITALSLAVQKSRMSETPLTDVRYILSAKLTYHF